jgi:hypothetical protein
MNKKGHALLQRRSWSEKVQKLSNSVVQRRLVRFVAPGSSRTPSRRNLATTAKTKMTENDVLDILSKQKVRPS